MDLAARVLSGDRLALARLLTQIENEQAEGVQLAEVVKAALAPAASAGMQRRWPKAAELLTQAEDDILAYMAFPAELWTRIYSTNPLERLNKEVKRRTNVVGVFPDGGSVTRLVGAVLLEIADEW
jgi:transposase-like protein